MDQRATKYVLHVYTMDTCLKFSLFILQRLRNKLYNLN